MGGLFIYRSVSVNKMVVRISTGDIADCHAVDNLCLGRASRRPQLETVRRVSAIVPADHRFSRALVGDGILSDRVDVGGSFDAVESPHVFRRLRGARDAAFNLDNRISFTRFIKRKTNKAAKRDITARRYVFSRIAPYYGASCGATRKGALSVGQRLADRARLGRPKAFRLR